LEDKPQWKLVLEAKYGGVGRSSLSIGRRDKASLWWRDLVGLGVVRGVAEDWLENAFVQNIGDGGETLFWHDNWCVGGPFVERFRRLFSISLQAEAYIKDMGGWSFGRWIWQLKWRRPFFVWEEEVYRDFLLLLEVVPISREKPSWSYRHDIGGLFSVKSNYEFLAPLLSSTSSLPHSLSGVVHKVWDSWAPSKVMVFSWQTLLSRIPTRFNLAIRGVVLEAGNVSSAVCGGGAETEDHLFL
jgi:hypothetical protein